MPEELKYDGTYKVDNLDAKINPPSVIPDQKPIETTQPIVDTHLSLLEGIEARLYIAVQDIEKIASVLPNVVKDVAATIAAVPKIINALVSLQSKLIPALVLILAIIVALIILFTQVHI